MNYMKELERKLWLARLDIALRKSYEVSEDGQFITVPTFMGKIRMKTEHFIEFFELLKETIKQ